VSVERRTLKNGQTVWRVRWREHGRNRARQFDLKRHADAWDAEVRRRRRLGELGLLDSGKQTLAEFAHEWFQIYAIPNLAPKTLQVYAALWDRHVLPRIGGLRLSELTPLAAQSFQAELRSAGLGDPTIIKTMSLLQNVLARAVAWQQIALNPIAAVTKPPQRRRAVASALSPHQVEAIRAQLEPRDATLTSVLAYAGLRPGEALALRWCDIRERTILVARAVSLGELRPTKTGNARSVKMLRHLVADLAHWKTLAQPAGESQLVFPNMQGDPWQEHDWRNWRRRIFQPAARAAELPAGVRPYDLRHAFCSLLLAEGRSIVEVATQMGHAPTMTLDTYGHVIAEMDESGWVSAEELIAAARMRRESVCRLAHVDHLIAATNGNE
jgi:integrase